MATYDTFIIGFSIWQEYFCYQRLVLYLFFIVDPNDVHFQDFFLVKTQEYMN
jgi:hypothetical protein